MSPLKLAIKTILYRAHIFRLTSLKNKFHILTYHMITDKPNGFYPQTPTKLFETQIAHLVSYYKVISLDDIVWRLKNRKSLRRCVAITFDDGFRDNYLKAYPILKKYRVPATIFLITGHIESGTPPWFIVLRHIFMKTGKESLNMLLGRHMVSLPMRTKQEKRAASDRVMAHLKECSDRQRLSFLENLCDVLEVHDFRELEGLMLQWSDINEMAENGILFGAHTVNHPVLSRIPLDTVERQIRESKEIIELKIGKPVTCFAYPFGEKAQYSPAIFPILAKLGFECAVTTERHANRHHTGVFELNRREPWDLGLV